MKSFKILLSVFLVVIMFSGCMNTQKLGDLTVVQGVAIDKNKDKTQVSIQYLNTSKAASATDSLDGNITVNTKGDGNNISDAISQMSSSLSKKIFFSQNKIVVFGNDYAKENLSKSLDFLLRSVDSRPDVAVAISETTGEDVLKSKENDARIPAENIYDLLELGEEDGLGSLITTEELLNLNVDKTSDIYMPILKAEKKNVSCQGIALFSNNKYVSSLDKNQTFGFLFAQNKIDGGVLTIKDKEMGFVGLEINSSKTKTNVTVKNKKIVYNCDISVKLMIDEMEKGLFSTLNDKKINELESLINSKIKAMTDSALFACAINKCDPFMIGKNVAKEDINYYNSIKDNWREELKNIDFKVSVNSQIQKVNENSVRE